MKPTLAQSARLLADDTLAARTRGASLAYEICLARCVSPVTQQATLQAALGKDYLLLAPVLRRLARALTVLPSDKASVDLVIAAARALAAVSALLVFAQRCQVHPDSLAHIAAPLRTRCAPALIAPLLATDLRIVAAARDALDQIVLLKVAHATPWIDLLMSLKTFRSQYAATIDDDPAQKNSLLSILLVRSAAHLKNVFLDAARAAGNYHADDSSNAKNAAPGHENNNHPHNTNINNSGPSYGSSDLAGNIANPPEIFRNNSWLRRRSSVSNATPPVRMSAMSSWRARLSEDAIGDRRSFGIFDKLRNVRKKKNSNHDSGNLAPPVLNSPSGTNFNTFDGRCDEENGHRNTPDINSIDHAGDTRGMRFSKRATRGSNASVFNNNNGNNENGNTEPDSGSRASLDSSKNRFSRRSLELAGKLPRPGRDGSVMRMPSYHRKKRRNNNNGNSNSPHGGAHGDLGFNMTMNGYGRDQASIENGVTWNGIQLGVGNRDIFAGMHIYQRLMSRELLPSIRDRCDVIDDLHKMVEPLLSGSAAEQLNVNKEALRCIVANAFLAHGEPIYKALLALVFRPAPSTQRTEKVMRQLSLNPEFQGCRAESGYDDYNIINGHRGTRRFRSNDIAFNILDSMSHMQLNAARGNNSGTQNGNTNQESGGDEEGDDSHANICLPNPECDTDTAYKCTALLLLLVREVPEFCQPRLALVTGTTNSAYWHVAEALLEDLDGGRKRRLSKKIGNCMIGRNVNNVAWSPERLFGAVQSLLLLNASLPDTTEKALGNTIGEDVEQLDCVTETCMRSVCATGCRLARIDARNSEPVLSDRGVIQSANAWCTLSKLPSQSVLWPSSQAYSSAVVFVAHLARRASVTVYRKSIREGTNGNDFEGDTNDVYEGKNGGEEEGETTAMQEALQDCVRILVNRNGSAVVIRDVYRILLYIIGCELRGSPTREKMGAREREFGIIQNNSNNNNANISTDGVNGSVNSHNNNNVLSRSGAKAASLPSRAPFFTRANNPMPVEALSMDETMPRMGTPFPESASCSDVDMDIDIVDVQSTSRLSYGDNESDMSGLLVGNIAVDGSRDCKLREIAAKAEGSAVASWFTGFCAPPLDTDGNNNNNNMNINGINRDYEDNNITSNGMNINTSTLRRRARSSQRDLSAPEGAYRDAYQAGDGSYMTMGRELFEELCTSLALVLNAVSVSAALEREDMTVAMDEVAQDVMRSGSVFVGRMHETAAEIVKSNRLGLGAAANALRHINPTALVQQVQSLQGEVTSLRSDVVLLRSQLAAIEDNWKRFRWPLRSFPRNNNNNNTHENNNTTTITNEIFGNNNSNTMSYTAKRASAV